MNCLIVDDNIIARTTLRQLAGRDPALVIAGECADAVGAFRQISAGQIDLLFLDIEMEGMSGIELVKALGTNRPVIIFTTAKSDYAVEAFELNVADYIHKPVTPARFLQAVEKAKDIFRSRTQEWKREHNHFLFFRDSSVIRKLKMEDILYAEAMGDYVKLYTMEKFFAVHTSLKDLEAKLPNDLFLRVHRSFLIQVGKIDTIEGGTLIINKKMVPVADSYRSQLNQRLGIL